MKKFLYGCLALLLILLVGGYVFYTAHIHLDIYEKQPAVFTKTEGKTILLNQGEGFAPFEIRGVDLGAGKPGYFATDFAITKEEYLRWFGQMQDMGANCVRVYTVLGSDFYKAAYEYNHNNPNPLYIIHGLWLNDYVLNSRRDAYDKEFLDTLVSDGKDLIDIIHGNKPFYLSNETGKASGNYTQDISPWVLGYILGVEWEDTTVAYTNHMQTDKSSYQGQYMYTTPEATPFEAMLAQLGDQLIHYETGRYEQQRLVAFSNWPTTDPFTYPQAVSDKLRKIACIDVENIQTTDGFLSGTFASYHVYPYYPDYLNYETDKQKYVDETGRVNTYQAYLRTLTEHHSIPVVISEFGVPSSRGMAQRDANTGRNQGNMSESQQGEALVDCYNDIMAAGCAGSVLFTWQDEWFKRTWNTMHYTDTTRTPNWSDYQTNEQYFGLLSFDPGREQSICYVDGDTSDWTKADVVHQNGDLTLSVKQDERYLYFLVEKPGLTPADTLYLPLDITPKSGALYSQQPHLTFEQGADFLVMLDGAKNSRVLVQERYEALRAIFQHEVRQSDAYAHPPAVDTPVFKPIVLVLQSETILNTQQNQDVSVMSTYETGLLTAGNANPSGADYNSLADYCYGTDSVEIKLPWLMLNFSSPAEGLVHDDYYLHYGIENLKIKTIYAGAATALQLSESPIAFSPVKLKRWGDRVTYHERLKPSYYTMQAIWGKEGSKTP